MMAFRHADARFPFLWESAEQPPGRWHGPNEGPAHYFADTPAGAWAEFLRHEEIVDSADFATIRRQIWAVEIGDAPARPVEIADAVARGGLETYAKCQAEARRLRARGAQRVKAPSAALEPGGARGWLVENGVQPGPARNGMVIIAFGPARSFIGWLVADAARPPEDLIGRVRHFR